MPVTVMEKREEREAEWRESWEDSVDMGTMEYAFRLTQISRGEL